MSKRLALLTLGLALLAAAPAAQAAVKDGYCSPTGDYCQGVIQDKPRITLGIHTFSFRGSYRLCTRFATARDYTCRRFRLRFEDHGIYGSNVKWQRYFPHARHGRYFAKWFNAGYQIGPIIWFRY